MSKFTDLLSDFDAEKHLICHLEPYIGGGETADLYYSTHGTISEPGDTPPNQYFDARLKRAYQFERSMFEANPIRLSGSSVPGFGSITLINTDGALDDLPDYGWGGRRVRVWLGGKDFALSEFGLVFDGVAEDCLHGDNEITVTLRDRKSQLDREIQPSVFAGSGGVEGGADVANRRKPIPFGICRNVPLLYLGVNDGKHTFWVGSNIIGVTAVRDLGIALTFTAGTPGSAQWTVDLDTGILTLGGSFIGPICADIIGTRYLSVASATSWTVGTGSKAFTVTAGQPLAVGMKVRVTRDAAPTTTYGDGVITGYSGTTLTVNITSVSGSGTHTDWTISPWGTVAGVVKAVAGSMGVSTFDAASFAAMDADQPATVGYYIPEGGNALEHLDAICNGGSCNHGFNRAGEYQIGRLEVPGTPDDNFGKSDIIDDALTSEAIEDPNYEIVVRYKRNWSGSMTDSQLAGAVSESDRAFLAQEWRQAKATNNDVLIAWQKSNPITVDSIFDEESDAAAEASRLLVMFGGARSLYRVRCKVKPLSLDIGQTITITHPRYGLAAGKALRIVRIAEDLYTNEVELEGWG
jgi:hypothetical protein